MRSMSLRFTKTLSMSKRGKMSSLTKETMSSRWIGPTSSQSTRTYLMTLIILNNKGWRTLSKGTMTRLSSSSSSSRIRIYKPRFNQAIKTKETKNSLDPSKRVFLMRIHIRSVAAYQALISKWCLMFHQICQTTA